MRSALEELPGVAKVETDVDARTATCTAEKGTFDVELAIKTLGEEGYEGSSLYDPSKEGNEAESSDTEKKPEDSESS